MLLSICLYGPTDLFLYGVYNSTCLTVMFHWWETESEQFQVNETFIDK